MKNKSERRAREILDIFIEDILKDFKEYLEGLILVGSLTNGSYIEGEGRDIDVISILKDDTDSKIKSDYIDKITYIEKKCNNDIPISKSVYYYDELTRPFITNIEDLRKNRYLNEVPVELFRIHESGIVLYGEGIKEQLPLPTKEEYLNFDKLYLKVRELIFKDDPNFKKGYLDTLENPPIRIAVQIILTRAFKHYYYATEKVCCNKHNISDVMTTEVPNYKFNNLLKLATDFKKYPNNDHTVEEVNRLISGCKDLVKWCENNPVDSVPFT